VETLHYLSTHADDERVRVAAAGGLVRVIEFAQRVAEYDDKTHRLDSGEATDRVEYRVELPEPR